MLIAQSILFPLVGSKETMTLKSKPPRFNIPQNKARQSLLQFLVHYVNITSQQIQILSLL